MQAQHARKKQLAARQRHGNLAVRGHSLMVKFQPSKLAMRVRFPLPALCPKWTNLPCSRPSTGTTYGRKGLPTQFQEVARKKLPSFDEMRLALPHDSKQLGRLEGLIGRKDAKIVVRFNETIVASSHCGSGGSGFSTTAIK
jgi:hypothetical protein